MSAHTPGPWNTTFFQATNGDLCQGVAASTGGAVAWVSGDDATAHANSHLIAAAPALLAALNAIVFQVRQGKVLERDACITQAVGAIKKARGAA